MAAQPQVNPLCWASPVVAPVRPKQEPVGQQSSSQQPLQPMNTHSTNNGGSTPSPSRSEHGRFLKERDRRAAAFCHHTGPVFVKLTSSSRRCRAAGTWQAGTLGETTLGQALLPPRQAGDSLPISRSHPSSHNTRSCHCSSKRSGKRLRVPSLGHLCS